MGLAGLMEGVVDAGPLTHLEQIGGLELLRVFTKLHIPGAVWAETVEQGWVAAEELLQLGIVQRHSVIAEEVAAFVQEHGLDHLHAGERECLKVCEMLGVGTLLTDDLAVREAATRMKITPVGSLGVIIRAYRQQLVSLAEAEQRINDLYSSSSLFVTKVIVELAIEQLREVGSSR